MLSTAVQAGVVVSVSGRHDSGATGTFGRPVLLDESWWLTWGAGGDLIRAPLDGDWRVDDGQRQSVLGRDDLVDHGLVPCADGTWLHVGSSNRVDHDDSSDAHWLTEDLVLQDQAVVEHEQPLRVHNDPAVVCSGGFRGVAHTGREPEEPSWWFDLSEPGTVGDPVALAEAPRLPGAGLLGEGGELLAVSTWNFVRELQLNRYDADLALVGDVVQAPVLGDDAEIWWPTGVVRVGQHLVVATIGAGLEDDWSADTGQVWLLVLDEDLAVVEEHPVSALSTPDGAMRPWLVRDGDRLLVTADAALEPRLWEVDLDLDAAGPDPEVGDSGATGGEGGGCGCAGAPGGPGTWLVLVALVAARRRDRRPSAQVGALREPGVQPSGGAGQRVRIGVPHREGLGEGLVR